MSNSGVYFVRNNACPPNSDRNRGKKDFCVLSTISIVKAKLLTLISAGTVITCTSDQWLGID